MKSVSETQKDKAQAVSAGRGRASEGSLIVKTRQLSIRRIMIKYSYES